MLTTPTLYRECGGATAVLWRKRGVWTLGYGGGRGCSQESHAISLPERAPTLPLLRRVSRNLPLHHERDNDLAALCHVFYTRGHGIFSRDLLYVTPVHTCIPVSHKCSRFHFHTRFLLCGSTRKQQFPHELGVLVRNMFPHLSPLPHSLRVCVSPSMWHGCKLPKSVESVAG